VFGVEIPVSSVFDKPTVKELARQIEIALEAHDGSPSVPRLQCVSREEPLALSFAQQRLWFIDQMEPGSAIYNVPVVKRLLGTLNVEALERALGELIRRHESLRTSFSMHNGEPVQVIGEAGEWRLEKCDLRGLLRAEREAAVEKLVSREWREGFDLSTGPLVRVKLLQVTDAEHVLLLTMHHVIADGWSMGILFRELTLLYNAYNAEQASPLAELEVQYADYAAWQREYLQGEVLAEQLSYWKEQLVGAPAVLQLPMDHARPAVQSYRGELELFELPVELKDQLQQLSQHENVTMFMTMLAAFQILLSRYSGQEDIVVGTPIAGRTRAEVEPLIGFFVNTLALRADLSGGLSFRELLKQVRERCLGAYAHQDIPFEKLVEELQPQRSLSHQPLFQVLFQLHDSGFEPLALEGLKVVGVKPQEGTTKFDLALSLVPSDRGVSGAVYYCTDLFERSSIKRLVQHFEQLLKSIVAGVEQPVQELRLLGAGEREQVLVEWNNTERQYASGRCLHELFEAQAALTPEHIALADQRRQLTYRELNERANQLAHCLQELKVGPEVLVGIMMERSLEMVVAQLGVLKAGGAYVPLDPQYPQERIDFMVADTQARIVLTEERLADRLRNKVSEILALDSQQDMICEHSRENPAATATENNLAYVIYTSGSSGRPKGVTIQHNSPVVLAAWARETFKPADFSGVLASTSICFDLSIFELFVPLSCGGSVILAADALQLPTLSNRERVTLINTVPSAMSELVRTKSIPASVRVVNLAGEALANSLVQQVYQQGVQHVYNLYGPSEDTTYSTSALIASGAEGTPTIGRPIANTQVYLLDRNLEPVPVGVAGEIYIGGAGLARGYLRQPELTAEKFIPDPHGAEAGARLYRTGDLGRYRADGTLEFLGRRDQQVKVRGYRIEPAEIEAVLCRQEQVREAVVVVREQLDGDKRLIAYVSPSEGSELEVEGLRRYLQERIPQYMMPAAIQVLERLPLTPNGKVDRKALPEVQWGAEAGNDYVAPRTEVEELLVALWTELLPAERIGVEDDFFALGGHSLLATRLLSRLREMFGVEVSLRALFEESTVAGLASQVERARLEGRGLEAGPLTAVSREQGLPLSFAQQRLWFLDQLEPNSSFYNIAVGRRLQGELQVAVLERSLNELARRHESLRTTFSLRDGQPQQLIAEPKALHLEVVDLSHLPAAEREADASRLARVEAQQPFALAVGPLWRTRLIKLSATEHVLLLTLHHIIADAWSMRVLFRELSTLYNAYAQGHDSPLTDLPVQYADYAVWQRQYLQGEVLERQLAYWRKQLAAAPALLALPTDHPRPAVQSRRQAHEPLTISPELTAQLRSLIQGQGFTLFMTFVAAFQVLLARYSKQDDIVVGTNFAGRNHPELEGMIGFFINTFVLRTDLSGNPTLHEVLKRVREVYLEAHAHQDVHFEKLVEVLNPQRSSSHSPIFQVKIDLVRNTKAALNFSSLKTRPFEFDGENSRYDMFLVLEETENNLRGAWSYNPDLFNPTTIERMVRDFVELLESFVKVPNDHLSALSSPAEGEANGKPKQKSRLASLKEFKSVRPKLMKVSEQSLFKSEPLIEGKSIPLLIRPEVENVDLADWAAHNQDFINTQLRKHGALLFSEFKVESLTKFEQFIRNTSGELLDYQDPSSPRSQIKGKLYSSTDYPAEQSIFLHNENSYSYSWPLKLFFFCVTPSTAGGETPIADNRRISSRIPSRIRKQFASKHVMYVRNFSPGLGLPWQTVFGTTDKTELESYCRSMGIEVEWTGPERLRTRQLRPAFAEHPETGELLWFNHAVFFHVSTLESSIRESLSNGLAEEDLPYNTYYGDGSPIEEDVLEELREIYREETVMFPWRQSQVLMLDNMLVAHARQPFLGPRKIVVGMAQPFTRPALIEK